LGKRKHKPTNLKGSYAINRIACEKFLDKNGIREEVITQGSSLQYEVLEKGDGGFVEYGSTITVNQIITLLDGKVISDTYKSGKPESFLLKDAIKGYHEGLLLMNVGDKFKFFIPPELAWGKRGTNAIPPFSLITIECHLVSID
jgi:FKBP-type peptidyl-prolyl cis-trans isomerase FkpA